MAFSKHTTRFRFWLWLIRMIGVIVPRRLRADWRQEWEAELRHRESLLADWDNLNRKTRLNLLRRSLGAFWDALVLQPARLEDEILQDMRYGMRMLGKSPAFTLAAVLSLAIGIGANTALFSVVNAVLWRSLPYPQAEQLMRVGEWSTPVEFVTLGESNHVFHKLAAWTARDFSLSSLGTPAHLKGQRVSSDLLSLLGVTPQVGRAFIDEEFQPGRDRVLLISDRLWRSRFGSDPQLIGQSLTLDRQPYTVVGVLPPRFEFFPSADVLTPLSLTAEDLRERHYYAFGIIARLKDGISLEEAQRELSGIARSFDEDRDRQLQPLRDLLVKDFRLTLLVLWGVVGFVLLIACANVANLMLARAANRRKELAIRAAVGARRTRLVRQLLTESVLVAGLSGALGLFCAYLGIQALLAANPAILPRLSQSAEMATIPRLGEVAINAWVLCFNAALTLFTGVLFGLAPALQFSRLDLGHALKDGASVSQKGFRLGLQRSTQSMLVIGEVSLALVLLIGAGLLIRSLWTLHRVEPGFEPDKLLTLHLEFPSFKYRDDAHVNSIITELSERIAGLPGVESVGAADSLPLTPIGSFGSISIEGRPDLAAKPSDLPFGVAPPPLPGSLNGGLIGPSAFFSRVSPGYLRTLRIPLRRGREFDSQDEHRTLPVAMINEAMAHRFWPQEDPLGKRFKADAQGGWRTVVGVVGNVRRFALEDQPTPEFYLPLQQPLEELTGPEASVNSSKKPKHPGKSGRENRSNSDQQEPDIVFTMLLNSTANQRLASHFSLMIRTYARPEAVADVVRQTVWSVDPEQPILRLGTMQDRLAEIFAARRFNLLLFGIFAVVALLLAAVGLYGVLAYMVTQRAHEIGIRLALGAQTRDVMWLIVQRGLALTLIGLAIGSMAALALTRLLQTLLFGVSTTDPPTFAGIALLLLCVACVASFFPARRATKVDPIVALRHE